MVTIKDGEIVQSIPSDGVVGVSVYGFGFLGGVIQQAGIEQI